jgi:hypothetical protein
MNLSGIICYSNKSNFSKTTKISSKQLNQLYFVLEIHLKDLFNSNDFSFLSALVQCLAGFYILKNNSLIEKRLSMIKNEYCIVLEELYLKKNFIKKIKNFSYWQSIQWTFEKEVFLNFYFFSPILNKMFLVNPSNYYMDSFLSSCLKREKIETWLVLVVIETLYSLDHFKEINWNLKSMCVFNSNRTNKDVFFNFLSNLNYPFYTIFWKYFINILRNVGITQGNLISCITIIMRFVKN